MPVPVDRVADHRFQAELQPRPSVATKQKAEELVSLAYILGQIDTGTRWEGPTTPASEEQASEAALGEKAHAACIEDPTPHAALHHI